MTIHKIYSLTSIGRPVDIKVRTNRNMLIGLLPTALFALTLAIWQGAPMGQALTYTLGAVLAAFGAWAIGRELAPDDQVAAFVAMTVTVFVLLLNGLGSSTYALLVLFSTLGLVRQVNRTTGLEARVSDSLMLLALTLWVIYATANPLFGLVAGLSFAFDGSLNKPLRRQLVFALLSFGAVVVYMVDHESTRALFAIPQSFPQWLAALVAVVYLLNILLLKRVNSVDDVARRPLDLARVRGGMAVALLAVVQGLPQILEVSLLAASIAGICVAAAFRRSFENPS